MATRLAELDVDLITRGHLQKGLDHLTDEFAGTFSTETVERHMAESVQAFAGARLKDFVPLFVHRFARERLRALGQVQGTIAKDVPEVLFVCVQNAGRSQVAAALLDQYAEGRVHVRSAGSAPAEQINANVVRAMSEIGVDISKEFPKPMTDEVVQAADVVITMGCGDACPIYPGKRYEDWEVDDPADADIEGVRRIRDDISDTRAPTARRAHLAGRRRRPDVAGDHGHTGQQPRRGQQRLLDGDARDVGEHVRACGRTCRASRPRCRAGSAVNGAVNVVSGGLQKSAPKMSSQPTTLMSRGTTTPRSANLLRAPMASMSLKNRQAVAP